MVFELNALVQIGEYATEYVSRVQIERTWAQLTDTATIELSKKLQFDGNDVTQLIKPGDAVQVFLGYNNELVREFSGYVRTTDAKDTFVVECDCPSYLLKQNRFSQTYQSVNAQQLVAELTEGLNIKLAVADIDLGKTRLNDLTPAQVLEQLFRENLGLVSFFSYDTETPVLHVGFPYSFERENGVKKILDRSRNAAKGNIELIDTTTNRIKIRAVSNFANGNKITVEVGDDNGTLHTRNYYEVDQNTLEEYANNELDNYKQQRVEGTITAFGQPYINHGDVVEYIDPQYPELAGQLHYVDAVNIDFSTGFERKIKIGRRAQ